MCIDHIVHVVDDDPDIRNSLSFLLRMEGYAVRAYEHAEAFISSMTQGGSGCVITDIHMPGMSGLDILEFLRSLQVPMPVIVMSAHENGQLAAQVMNMGAADFFKKPLDCDALLVSILRNMNHAAPSYCANPLICRGSGT